MLSRAIKIGLSTWLATAACVTNAGAEELLSTIERSELNPSQSAAVTAIEKLPTSGEVKIVKVNTTLLRESHNLRISLSGYSAKLIARDVEVKDKGFRWIGEVSEQPKSSTVMIVNDQFVTASIQAPDALYRIRPVGGTVHALIKVSNQGFPPER